MHTRARDRNGGKQRLGVGVPRRREQGPLVRELDDLAEIHHRDPVRDVLEGFDALILLIPRIEPESFPKDGRLAIIARFGVGYDTVNVQACTTVAARW